MREAADLLGWGPHVAPRMTLFGVEVHPVVAIDARAHELRRRSHQPPVLDHDVLAMWQWPEAAPMRAPEVVTLRGVLCSARSWRSGLSRVSRLRGFCSTAVVVTAPLEREEECLLECKLLGVGVLERGPSGLRLVEPARDGRSPQARRRTLDAWVEELIYRELLRAGILV
ncbi:hypothetical protein [Saccharopolyspora hordei]|uniref:Uncharacterized protein n=1 Tax=Saccharopolyspora hordei TaxID=1838 RepID=A0A853AHA6_9PSEU|nr:hypothetical protein [Saccharopolyspora hordei]NYI83972.1 hypothetical protein [Saccharopolyspora hordei]